MSKIARWGLILSSFIVALGFSVKGEALAQKPANPNILLIVSDDQGCADIGYNNSEIRSPNLDALAAGGVKFTCHYVQPQCTPTRVALMTGRYPSRFGPHCTQASVEQAYPLGTLTMASYLKANGYETAITGKWHMGSKPEWGPNHYGFDYSYGCLSGAVGMYDHRYRLDTPYAQTWHRNLEFIEEEGHSTDLIAREAIQWIEKKRDKPYFLYVPFNAAHTPLVEEDKWIDMNKHITHPDRRLFAAAVTHMDAAIGEIVQALDRTGQRENTLILFTSDNGAMGRTYKGGAYPAPDPSLTDFSFNTPWRGRKSEVYEGGMRVPAFANMPSVLKPRVEESPMHAVDWLPTIAGLLGAKPEGEPQWDGQDVGNMLFEAGEDYPERMFYWVWGKTRNREALRKGPWKVLRNNAKGTWELYNLDSDPYEAKDLSVKEAQKFTELMALFEAEKAKDRL